MRKAGLTIEQEICRKIEKITGKPIEIGATDLIHILTHPDVIHLTRQLIDRREEEINDSWIAIDLNAAAKIVRSK